MRILLATPLLLVSACNVSTDTNNSEMTLQYNQETAQNAIEDVGNTAENIGAAIANEAEETANKVNEKVAAGNESGENKSAENKQ
jgi:hypothetical protein